MPRHQRTIPQGPEQVLAALRGERPDRVPVDRAWSLGLREHLQDEVGALLGAGGPQVPRTVGWRALAGPAAARPPIVELLARQVFRQWVVAGAVGDPLDDAVDAVRAAGDADPLLRALRQLAPGGRRALTDRLQRHARWLERCWPPLDPRWAPVTGELRTLPLAGGRVLVGARSDLAVGRPAGRWASRCLVAVTDGAPSAAGPWHRLRLAALAEATATGAAPFRLVVVAPATGVLVAEAVDACSLWATATAVVAAAGRAAVVAASGTPAPVAARGTGSARSLTDGVADGPAPGIARDRSEVAPAPVPSATAARAGNGATPVGGMAVAS